MPEAWTEITDDGTLTEVVGVPLPHVAHKERPRLAPLDRDWLAASTLCVVATCDDRGNLDASPKGDPAGSLVHVLDDHTIALAERPGNRRVDGYRNVLRNPTSGSCSLSRDATTPCVSTAAPA